MTLIINQCENDNKNFFASSYDRTSDKSTNNQAVKYQNIIASLSTIQDTALIAELFEASKI